jgi:hypothetical protein
VPRTPKTRNPNRPLCPPFARRTSAYRHVFDPAHRPTRLLCPRDSPLAGHWSLRAIVRIAKPRPALQRNDSAQAAIDPRRATIDRRARLLTPRTASGANKMSRTVPPSVGTFTKQRDEPRSPPLMAAAARL